MNLSKFIKVSLILMLMGIFLGGCSTEQYKPNNSDTEGYILEVEGNRVLLAEHISSEKYNEIKDIPVNDLKQKQSLIYITYEDANDFQKGNEIEVWLEGEVATTNPGQAKAEIIKLK